MNMKDNLDLLLIALTGLFLSMGASYLFAYLNSVP